MPLVWAPPAWALLFASVPHEPPPEVEIAGFRVVTRDRLLRDLLGFYGLRTDLLAEIEAKLTS